jgi:hypothetical protein
MKRKTQEIDNGIKPQSKRKGSNTIQRRYKKREKRGMGGREIKNIKRDTTINNSNK